MGMNTAIAALLGGLLVGGSGHGSHRHRPDSPVIHRAIHKLVDKSGQLVLPATPP